jgi:hypothetical protein
VPKVVRAMQIQAIEHGAWRHRQRRPGAGRIVGRCRARPEAGRRQPAERGLDGGGLCRSALCGKPDGEPIGALRATSPQGLERSGGGGPQLACGVGELGEGGVVGAAEVVARQYRPVAVPRHPRPAAAG